MTELGQLHLQLALVGGRALGEDVQDEAGARQHAGLEVLLEVALLGGREGVVEDDQLRLVLGDGGGDLLGLAGADEETGIGCAAAAADQRQRLGAGRDGQLAQLRAAVVVLGRVGQLEVDEDRAFTAARAFEEVGGDVGDGGVLRLLLFAFLLRLVAARQLDVA